MDKKIYLGIVLTVAGFSFFFIFFMGEDNELQEELPSYVTVITQMRDERLKVLGTLFPVKQVQIGVQVSGQLEQLLVNDGDWVTAGQIVAQIDPRIAKTEYRSALATFESAKLRLSDQKRKAKLEKEQVDRLERLLGHQAIAANDVRMAKDELARLKIDIQIAERQVQLEKEQVRKSEQNLKMTTIRSPIDGIVVNTVVKAGQTLTASQVTPVLMKVVNIDEMEIKVAMTEAEIIKVKAGMQAWVKPLHSQENPVSGIVHTVLPVPEDMNKPQGAKRYTCIIKVSQIPKFAMIGMTVDVGIVLSPIKNMLLLDRKANLERISDNQFRVKVLENSNWIDREIIIGQIFPLFFEIKSGLKMGDKVAMTPSNKLNNTLKQ